MFKLQNKISLLFVTISIVPLILMAAVGIYFVNLTQENSVYNIERQLLLQKEKEIENFINFSRGVIEIKLVASVWSPQYLDPIYLESILDTVIKVNKNIVEVAFLNYNAKDTADETIGKELIKYNSEGKVAENLLMNRRTTEGFRSAITGKIFYDRVIQADNKPLLPIYVPLRNREDTIIGVVYATIHIGDIQKIMRESSLGDEGYTYLADTSQHILFKSSESLKSPQGGSPQFITSVLGSQIIKTIKDSDSEFVGSANTVVLASGKQIPSLHAALVIEWPKADAMAIVYSSITRGLTFTAIILLLVVALGILFARNIVGPIKVLEEGAKIIGQGDFNYSIKIRTKDELEDLANSFNTMAESLKDVQDLRESKIIAQGLARSLAKEQDLSRIKDTFISTASHQLRTPISVIRWISEALSQTKDDTQIKEIKGQIGDLYQNSAKMSLIISDLLTVSELGLSYKPIDVSKIDLTEKVGETIERFESEAKAKHISVSLKKSGDQPIVTANALAIRKVLENLIDNAITYSHENSVIEVMVTGRGRDVLVSIKDSGIGVPEDDKKFVFEEFFRAKNSVEKKNVGTGLGLFIVKTIVAGHKGEIDFESKQNEGSTFWFTLPRS